MNSYAFALALTVTLALQAVPAHGASPRFGLQGTLSLPQDDLQKLVDSGKGLGVGLFVDCPVLASSTLRPRLDLIRYQTATFQDPGYRDERQWSTSALGVDYLWYVDGRRSGCYVALGLVETRFHQDLKVNGVPDASETTRLGLSLGLGYGLDRHWEANLRITRTEIGSITMTALNLGVAYLF
jgi:hypothetical protein